jgi:predicted Zn-dependent protease
MIVSRRFITKRCAFVVVSALLLLLVSCASVPVTGRKQVKLVSDAEVMAMSYQQYDQFLAENQLCQDAAVVQSVRRVGEQIQNAVERYFAERGLQQELEGYAWEYNVVESEQVNAWCMPGGKVVFYTGILPYFETEADLAVVMGHEIAHAVAEHGAERMSQQLMQQAGSIALEELVEGRPQAMQELVRGAYAIGSHFGAMLPYSRLHESEADYMGLIFMAMAGYDPRTAPRFWQRMAASSSGAKPPEFMSTHPSDETRMRQLNERMDEALQVYQPSSP